MKLYNLALKCTENCANTIRKRPTTEDQLEKKKIIEIHVEKFANTMATRGNYANALQHTVQMINRISNSDA